MKFPSLRLLIPMVRKWIFSDMFIHEGTNSNFFSAFLGLLGVLNSRNIRLINEDESKQEDKKLDSSLAYIDESKAPKEEKRSLMAGMSLHARGLTSVHVGSVSKRAMVFVS